MSVKPGHTIPDNPTPPSAIEEARKIVQRHQDGLTGHIAVEDVIHDIARALSEREQEVEQEVEQARVQMAGVSTAAMGWISDPAKEGDYGWSVPYQDVLTLRRKYEELRREMERLREALGFIKSAALFHPEQVWPDEMKAQLRSIRKLAHEALLTRRTAQEPSIEEVSRAVAPELHLLDLRPNYPDPAQDPSLLAHERPGRVRMTEPTEEG